MDFIKQIGNASQAAKAFNIYSAGKNGFYAALLNETNGAQEIAFIDQNGNRKWSVLIPGEIISMTPLVDGICFVRQESLNGIKMNFLLKISSDEQLVLNDFIGMVGGLDYGEDAKLASSRDAFGDIYYVATKTKSGSSYETTDKNGQTISVFSHDITIKKFKSSYEEQWSRSFLEEQWSKTFGGQGDETIEDLIVSTEGVIYATGKTTKRFSEGTNQEPGLQYIWSLSPSGEERTFYYSTETSTGESQIAYDFDIDAESNLYVLYQNSPYNILTKYKPNGIAEWSYPLESINSDVSTVAQFCVQGDTIGAIRYLSEQEIEVLLLNLQGEVRYREIIRGTLKVYGSDIAGASDNQFFIAGNVLGNIIGSVNNNLEGVDIFAGKISRSSIGNTLATGKPLLFGTPKPDHSLVISIDNVQDSDNFAGFIPDYKYTWQESIDNGKSWVNLTINTGNLAEKSFLLLDSQVGKQIRALVQFKDGAGFQESLYTNSFVIAPQVLPFQSISPTVKNAAYSPSSIASIPLKYTTSTEDVQLSGLTLNVHYNSSILTPTSSNNGVIDQTPATIATNKIVADTNNLDGDPLTDKILQLVWTTFDNTFPNKTLPATLATLNFNTSAQKTDPVTGKPTTTTIRYTASETAATYDFVTASTTLTALPFSLDVDGDGQVKALTDGLMIIRKLLGPAFDDDALTFKAMSSTATRTTSEIHIYLQQAIDGGLLDIDKNGKTGALTDGLMVIRRLLGPAFDGDELTYKALSSDSPYFGKADASTLVAANIDALCTF